MSVSRFHTYGHLKIKYNHPIIPKMKIKTKKRLLIFCQSRKASSREYHATLKNASNKLLAVAIITMRWQVTYVV